MPSRLSPGLLETTLSPLLTALATPSSSHEAPSGLLLYLSPILRQRVKYLSSPSSPWMKHLSQDAKLYESIEQLVSSGTLEVHPLSGVVELDWTDNIAIVYNRVDIETCNAFVRLGTLDHLTVKLLWTVDDPDSSSSDWKIDAVFTPAFQDTTHFPSSLDAAESAFTASQPSQPSAANDEDADDDYWALYDATPNSHTPAAAATPAAAKSPAPGTPLKQALRPSDAVATAMSSAERAYFDMYEDVQPALDSHDPGEAEHVQAAGIASTLGPAAPPGVSAEAAVYLRPAAPSGSSDSSLVNVDIVHPRPESASSSRGSETVEKLEAVAQRDEDTDFAVRQHISRTVRGLYQLARGVKMTPEEFARLVQGEMELLALQEE
ncbi:hypothetical protein TD95_002654 [Thielaviopsis punctulata]|uniref:Uncharacterized protein n=1 Tax=Thielaviopsis punctulata TaxID=72032 RepID=A0A0F4ZJ82_9PEZI|nr:hypothetical protein TD95_002654 [Thielaviopsis punctulata]